MTVVAERFCGMVPPATVATSMNATRRHTTCLIASTGTALYQKGAAMYLPCALKDIARLVAEHTAVAAPPYLPPPPPPLGMVRGRSLGGDAFFSRRQTLTIATAITTLALSAIFYSYHAISSRAPPFSSNTDRRSAAYGVRSSRRLS